MLFYDKVFEFSWRLYPPTDQIRFLGEVVSNQLQCDLWSTQIGEELVDVVL